MKASWFATHRSSAATMASGAMLAALIATVSVSVPAHPADDAPPAGDTGVWVTNGRAQAVGRFDADLAEFDTVVPVAESDTDLVQSGQWVVSVDSAADTATRIDPATSRAVGSVALPSPASGVLLMGDDAVVFSADDGRIWTVPTQRLTLFDANRAPDLSLGAGAVVSSTPGGGLLALSPSTHELVRAEPGSALADAQRTGIVLPDHPDDPALATGGGAQSASAAENAMAHPSTSEAASSPQQPAAEPALQLAATPDSWAVLDRKAAALVTAAGTVDLSAYLTAPDAAGGASAAHQSASLGNTGAETPDQGDASVTAPASAAALPVAQLEQTAVAGDGHPVRDRPTVFVATPSSLFEIDLATSAVRLVSGGHSGNPARPVQLAGCAFAAWSDGSSWQRCDDETDAAAASGTPAPAGRAGTLANMPPASHPVFRSNSDRVVLNDPGSGAVWAVQSGNRLVDDWGPLLPAQPKVLGAPVVSFDWNPPADLKAQLDRGTLEGENAGRPGVRSIAGGPVDPDVADGGPGGTGEVPSSPSQLQAGQGNTAAQQPPPGQKVDDPADENPVDSGQGDDDPGDQDSGDQGPGDQPGDPEAPAFGPPIATTVSASLDLATGTVSLSWPSFGDDGDAVQGYYAQSLGPDATVPAGDAACASPSPPSSTVRAPSGGEVSGPGSSTTASFSGISQPGAEYGFVVWGYNQAGCTPSALVTVTPPPVPGPIETVSGSMVEVNTALEYQLDPPSPEAPRYEVQRLDAVGTPTGDVATFDGGSTVLPRTLTGGPFGEVYAFQLRACNEGAGDAACGPWSQPQAAGEPSLTFAPAGLGYSAETGRWYWDALPDNGALAARVRCGTVSDSGISMTLTTAACYAGVLVSADDAWLRISVGSHSRQFPVN